jgi:hypothetical protein
MSATIDYFGIETVERAIAHHFMNHGVSEEVRDKLIIMEIEDGDEFFQMVENFVEMQGLNNEM